MRAIWARFLSTGVVATAAATMIGGCSSGPERGRLSGEPREAPSDRQEYRDPDEDYLAPVGKRRFEGEGDPFAERRAGVPPEPDIDGSFEAEDDIVTPVPPRYTVRGLIRDETVIGKGRAQDGIAGDDMGGRVQDDEPLPGPGMGAGTVGPAGRGGRVD